VHALHHTFATIQALQRANILWMKRSVKINLLNATTPCQDDDVCALAGEVPVTTLSSEMA
jgi:hypothetical protein